MKSIPNKMKQRPSSRLLFLQPDGINYAIDAENVWTGYTASTKEMFHAEEAEESKTKTQSAILHFPWQQHKPMDDNQIQLRNY